LGSGTRNSNASTEGKRNEVQSWKHDQDEQFEGV
jgi:hypothetical protein